MTDSHTPPHPPVSQFVLSAPPDTVGGNLNDTDTVRQCLKKATRFFHDSLSSDVRAHITDKWGIQDKMIDARQIGYVDNTNDIVTQLLDAGYSPLNITRAGLGTAPLIKHIFECDGVSVDNTHLVDTATHPGAVAESCPHTVPERIDELAAALATGSVKPEAVDLDAVATYVAEESVVSQSGLEFSSN